MQTNISVSCEYQWIFFYVSFIELSHTESFWKILIDFNTCRIFCYTNAWKLDCFLFSIDKSHKEYGIHILSTASNILTILEALLLSRNWNNRCFRMKKPYTVVWYKVKIHLMVFWHRKRILQQVSGITWHTPYGTDKW